MESPKTLLAAHPFFTGMDERQLELLARCGEEHLFEPGRYLFKEGDPSTCLYAVLSGKLSIELPSPGELWPVLIEQVRAGEIAGWSSLVPPHRKRFDGRAVEPTRAVVLNTPRLRALFEAHVELERELLGRVARLLARRLDAVRMQLLDMYAVAR